jgi:hypothetical protein
MLYNFDDPSSVFFGEVPKFQGQLFRPIIDRAFNLINIDENQASILPKKLYDLEGMLLYIGEDYYGEQIYPDYKETSSSIKYTSAADLLYRNIDSLELESSDEFSWPQYFGLLGIMEVKQNIITSMFLEDAPEQYREDIESGQISYLLSSLEAVCFGEVLGAKNLPTSGLVKDKISKQAQNAIRIRYQPLNDVKSNFLQFYVGSSDKSNKSKIARKFYRSLSEEQKRVLTSTLKIENACRTLINHLNRSLNFKPFSRYS